MEETLPPPMLLEILSRLSNSADLARSRLVSKTFNSLSYDVTSITFLFSYNHYTKSRSSNLNPFIPFKSIVKAMIKKMNRLDSVSIGVDELLQNLSYDDVEDDGYDLHLTDVDFVSSWLPLVGAGLKTLSFVDFWVQSCSRRSDVLSLISGHCQRLSKLDIKNAWLSLDGVTIMSSLTSLTLEFIRLDDENLLKLNDCFPCLETLNLIGVGGLQEPKICLQHLKSCQWTVSNFPLTLTIVAPKMVKLKLTCVRPRSLVLDTPLLSDFLLTIEKAGTTDIGELPNLKILQLKSRHIGDLVHIFLGAKAVNELMLDSPNGTELVKTENFSLDVIFDVFPNISSLKLGPDAYSEMEASFNAGLLEGRIGMKCLKDFTAHLVVKDIEVTLSFISFLLEKCNNLSELSLLINHEFDSLNGSNFLSRCLALSSKVKWKWGFWREGSTDVWVCNAV